MARIAGAVLVIDTGEMLGALYEAVEIVSIHSVAVARSREAESLAYVGWNHRVCLRGTRQHALFDRQHKQVGEVEAACFKHSHDL